MTSTTETILKLYVGTYAKHNNGSIEGDWLDLQDYSNAEEFMEACRELHEDEEDPEFMFQDYEGIKQFYSESMSEDKIQEIYDFIDAAENSHLDLCIIIAYCENIGDFSEGQISEAEDNYSGTFSSDEDFAENMADELGYMNESKCWPFTCIDWTWAARELMYDYFESNGHYFRNC